MAGTPTNIVSLTTGPSGADLTASGAVDNTPQPPPGWTPSGVVFPSCASTSKPIDLHPNDNIVQPWACDSGASLADFGEYVVAVPTTDWATECARVTCSTDDTIVWNVTWDGTAWQNCPAPT